jgi:filamentous hemagglutinin
VLKAVVDGATRDGDPTNEVRSAIEFTVKATEPLRNGTQIPESFELTIGDLSVRVVESATKHFPEVLRAAEGGQAAGLCNQLLLEDFAGAVQAAGQQGIVWGEKMWVGNWELIFGPPSAEGLLPVLYHAVYNP